MSDTKRLRGKQILDLQLLTWRKASKTARERCEALSVPQWILKKRKNIEKKIVDNSPLPWHDNYYADKL